mmetsp:Transcript_25692/g.64515  ORF Transcript_25692/g.64515 Transcript_25692/m.64515 type:complete len:465 (-) Transcript_25692:107-1501(-)
MSATFDSTAWRRLLNARGPGVLTASEDGGDVNLEWTWNRSAPPFGRGAFSKVYRAVHQGSGIVGAMKVIPLNAHTPSLGALRTEISVLKTVDHPFIVKLLASYEDEKNLYLVTNFCEGGELFDFLHLKGTYSEEFASTLLRRLLLALEYLHKQGIVHRDLKPENLLLRKPNDALSVVLVDFGLSGRVSADKPLLYSRCGSPHYCAPEVLGRCGYNEKVDIWSVGCIAFALLSGTLPFDASNNAKLKKLVRSGRWEFDEFQWQGVSREARRFVSSLLVFDPQRRPSATAMLADPWLDPSRHLSLKSILRLKEGLVRTSLPMESTCSRVLSRERLCSGSVDSPRGLFHSSEGTETIDDHGSLSDSESEEEHDEDDFDRSTYYSSQSSTSSASSFNLSSQTLSSGGSVAASLSPPDLSTSMAESAAELTTEAISPRSSTASLFNALSCSFNEEQQRRSPRPSHRARS